jgi:hypothetical protein
MDMPLDTMTQGRQLDTAPPRPPRQGQSLMTMASGGDSIGGMDMSNPAVQAMKAMGDARNALMQLAAMLPGLAQGIQQVISGLEAVVPQQVADIVAGNPPGSGGAPAGGPPMGAPQGQAPLAPPGQPGMSQM